MTSLASRLTAKCQMIDMPIFNDIMEPVEEEKLWLSTIMLRRKPAVIRKNTGKGQFIFGSTLSRESMKGLLECTGILEPFQEMLQTPRRVEVIH